jgi:hypothetical protein
VKAQYVSPNHFLVMSKTYCWLAVLVFSGIVSCKKDPELPPTQQVAQHLAAQAAKIAIPLQSKASNELVQLRTGY